MHCISERVLRQVFRVNPFDMNLASERVARVTKRFGHRQICIVQLDVFSDKADGNGFVCALFARNHLLPLGKIGRGRVDLKLAADDGGEIGLFEHQGRFIEARDRNIFNHAVGLYVAEHRNLLENRGLERLVAAEHDDIGVDAHAEKLLHGVLRGLGFMLVRATQKRHQRDMDKEAVLPSDFEGNLPNRFDEGLRFNVTDGAADFGNDHIGVRLLTDAVHEILDFICNVRDDLHGRAEILAPALFIEDVPVDLAGCEVRVFVEVFVDEALVVAEVKVGFCAVFGHVDLSVLIRAHRAGVDVDVGVELLRRDLESAHFEKPTQACGRDALAETRDHAAGYKDVFCHNCFLRISISLFQSMLFVGCKDGFCDGSARDAPVHGLPLNELVRLVFRHFELLNEHPLRPVDEPDLRHLLLQRRSFLLHAAKARARGAEQLERGRKKRGGGRLLERQNAAWRNARGHVGVLFGAHEKKNARLRALADIEGEIRAEFVRQRRVDDQKIIAALQKTSPGA